ncbi:MAG: hypothetical protein DRH15_07295 [Deltaproteobacteria bacterium]|nr:MAG: hypothetical protein DRH15_07295 [Deltaproteobacteria bacterium]
MTNTSRALKRTKQPILQENISPSPWNMSPNSKQPSFLKAIETGFPHPAIVVMCGLPATCKTWAASIISQRHGFEHLRTDIIRKELLGKKDIFKEKVASNMKQREKIYDVMFDRAEKIASQHKGVILDATFVKQTLRERAAVLAVTQRFPLVLVHTECPEDIALRRISARTIESFESNAITPQAYYNNLSAFEPIDLGGLKKKFPSLDIVYFRVDTSVLDPEKWVVREYVNKAG